MFKPGGSLNLWEAAPREPVSSAIGLEALISTIIGGSSITIAGITISAAAIGGALVSVGITYGLSSVSASLQRAALKKQLGSLAADAASTRVPNRAGSATRQLILGEVLKSGTAFKQGSRGGFFWLGLVLASDEIDGLSEFRIGTSAVPLDTNGYPIAAPYFAGGKYYLQVSFRPGTADQLIDPIIAADFPSNANDLDSDGVSRFRQRGLPCVVIKLYAGADANEKQGVWGSTDPNPLLKLRGSRVFDPRDAAQSPYDSSTWKWSRNGPLNYARWRTHVDFGKVDWSEIDIPALARAADIADQIVRRKDGSLEPRYRLDGIVDSGSDPAQTEADLMLSFLGERHWEDGKIVLSAGVPRDPTCTLTDRTMRGGLEASTATPWGDAINTVRSSFVAADAEYSVAAGPVYRSDAYIAAHAAWAAAYQAWVDAGDFSSPPRACRKSIRSRRIFPSSPRRRRCSASAAT
jgi:hypothetical protein